MSGRTQRKLGTAARLKTDAAAPEGWESCPPYSSSLEHLRAELTRIDLLVRMQAIRVRQLTGDDAFRGLVIADADALSLLELPPGAPSWSCTPEIPALEARLVELRHLIDRRRAAGLVQGPPLRLAMLAARFGLQPLDIDVLLLGLAPELDSRYERLYSYLHDDVTRKRPSVDLALALFCPSFEARLGARARFAPEAPLLRHRLIELFSDAPAQRPTRLGHFFKTDERIIDFLLGGDALDARLCACARIVAEALPLGEVLLADSLKERISRLASRPGRQVIYLQGPSGVGRRTIAGAVARGLGKRSLLVDLAALVGADDDCFTASLRLALREGLLSEAVVLFERFDVLLGEGSTVRRDAALRILAEADGLVFLSGEQAFTPPALGLAFVRIELPFPAATDRARLWTRALASEQPLLTDVELAALASRHPLSGGQIHDAIVTARRLADLDPLGSPGGPLSMKHLSVACREHAQPRLGSLASRVRSTATWEDLVVSQDRLDRLREIGTHARHRDLVLTQWGFDHKLPTGRGLSVLFSGPPGTGKTLAASVLANHLGLDLYQIDLSMVVSKYIGETEKQLAQVFAEAESGNAVLFFDEADALFGERGKTRDAHDRYANMEVAYLLQRMDSYAGIVILATNLARNMDDAFMRRLRFIIDFPLPDEAERLRIWATVLPTGVPRAADLDLDVMAKRFELPGGYIRNIALAATFLAAEQGQPLSQHHLLRAARREYQKLGKIMDERLFALAS